MQEGEATWRQEAQVWFLQPKDVGLEPPTQISFTSPLSPKTPSLAGRLEAESDLYLLEGSRERWLCPCTQLGGCSTFIKARDGVCSLFSSLQMFKSPKSWGYWLRLEPLTCFLWVSLEDGGRKASGCLCFGRQGDLAGVCFTHLKIIAVAEAAACGDSQPKSTKNGAIKHQGKED